MTSLKIKKYLKNNPLSRKLEYYTDISEIRNLSSVAIIPVYSENEYINATLASLKDSLMQMPLKECKSFLTVLIINNPPLHRHDAESVEKFQNNQILLRDLREGHFQFAKEFNIAWIDASSEGKRITTIIFTH